MDFRLHLIFCIEPWLFNIIIKNSTKMIKFQITTSECYAGYDMNERMRQGIINNRQKNMSKSTFDVNDKCFYSRRSSIISPAKERGLMPIIDPNSFNNNNDMSRRKQQANICNKANVSYAQESKIGDSLYRTNPSIQSKYKTNQQSKLTETNGLRTKGNNFVEANNDINDNQDQVRDERIDESDFSSMRNKISLLVSSKYFKIMFTVIIMLDSLNYTFILNFQELAKLDKVSLSIKVTNRLDYIFFVSYLIELLLTMIAQGLSLSDNSYFKSSANIFDFSLIIFSILPYFSQVLYLFRTIRYLRIARIVRYLPKLQDLLIMLFYSLKEMLGLILYIIYFLLACSYVAVVILNNKLDYRCVKTPFPVHGGYIQSYGSGIEQKYIELNENFSKLTFRRDYKAIGGCGQKNSCPIDAFCRSYTEAFETGLYFMNPSKASSKDNVFSFKNINNAMFSIYISATSNSIVDIANLLVMSYNFYLTQVFFFIVVIVFFYFFILRIIIGVMINSCRISYQISDNYQFLRKRIDEVNLIISNADNPEFDMLEYFHPRNQYGMTFLDEFEQSKSNSQNSISSDKIFDPTSFQIEIDLKKIYKLAFSMIAGFKIGKNIEPFYIFHKKWNLSFFCFFVTNQPISIFLNFFLAFSCLIMIAYQENIHYNTAYKFALISLMMLICAYLLMSIIGHGVKNYFGELQGIFDFGVMMLSWVELGVNGTMTISCLYSFRTLSLLFYLKCFRSLGIVYKSMISTLKEVCNYLVLLAIFIFFFAITGQNLFQGKLKFLNTAGEQATSVSEAELYNLDHDFSYIKSYELLTTYSVRGEIPLVNFESFYNSVIAIFYIFIGHSWDELFKKCYLSEAISIWYTYPFFIVANFVLCIILRNLVIAILIFHFEVNRRKYDLEQKYLLYLSILKENKIKRSNSISHNININLRNIMEDTISNSLFGEAESVICSPIKSKGPQRYKSAANVKTVIEQIQDVKKETALEVLRKISNLEKKTVTMGFKMKAINKLFLKKDAIKNKLKEMAKSQNVNTVLYSKLCKSVSKGKRIDKKQILPFDFKEPDQKSSNDSYFYSVKIKDFNNTCYSKFKTVDDENINNLSSTNNQLIREESNYVSKLLQANLVKIPSIHKSPTKKSSKGILKNYIKVAIPNNTNDLKLLKMSEIEEEKKEVFEQLKKESQGNSIIEQLQDSSMDSRENNQSYFQAIDLIEPEKFKTDQTINEEESEDIINPFSIIPKQIRRSTLELKEKPKIDVIDCNNAKENSSFSDSCSKSKSDDITSKNISNLSVEQAQMLRIASNLKKSNLGYFKEKENQSFRDRFFYDAIKKGLHKKPNTYWENWPLGFSLLLFSPKLKLRKSLYKLLESKYIELTALLLAALDTMFLALEYPSISPYNEVKVYHIFEYVISIFFFVEMCLKIIVCGLFFDTKNPIPFAISLKAQNKFSFSRVSQSMKNVLTNISFLNKTDGHEAKEGSKPKKNNLFENIPAHFRNIFNIIDGFVSVYSFILFIMIIRKDDVQGLQNFKYIKVIAALRPLTMINKTGLLKQIVETIFQSIKMILSLMIVIVFICLILGIIMFNLLGNSLGVCNIVHYKTKSDCNEFGGEWTSSRYSYEKISSAILILLELGSGENWFKIMFTSLFNYHNGVLSWHNFKYFFFSLLFLAVLSVVNIFILNLLYSVIVDSYSNSKEKQLLRLGLNTNYQKKSYLLLKAFLSKKPNLSVRARPEMPFSQKRAINLIKSPFFSKVQLISIFVFYSSLLMVSQNQSTLIFYIQYVVFLLFIIESNLSETIRIYAYRHKYFKDFKIYRDLIENLLVFIAFIVESMSINQNTDDQNLLSGSGTLENKFSILPLVLCLKLVKVRKLTKLSNRLKEYSNLLKQLIPNIASISCLIVLLFIIYSIVGMSLFGSLKYGSYINSTANFETFENSLFTLLKCLIGGNWNLLMREAASSLPACSSSNGQNYLDLQNHGANLCGTYVSYIYFLGFFIFFYILMMNLFVAIIVDSFLINQKTAELIKQSLISTFLRVWNIYDPYRNLYVSSEEAIMILITLPSPIGFNEVNYINLKGKKFLEGSFLISPDKELIINKANIIILSKEVGIDLSGEKVHLIDIVRFIVKKLLNADNSKADEMSLKRNEKYNKTLMSIFKGYDPTYKSNFDIQKHLSHKKRKGSNTNSKTVKHEEIHTEVFSISEVIALRTIKDCLSKYKRLQAKVTRKPLRANCKN